MQERGIFPDYMYRRYVESRFITGETPINTSRVIGPSSIDLTLGKRVYAVAGSSTPGKYETVEKMLDTISKSAGLKDFDISDGYVLSKGTIHFAELNESLDLPVSVRGMASPKSTTGRLDILARVVADRHNLYDNIPGGYKGKLFLEIHPQTFNIHVKSGDSLSQLRLYSCDAREGFTLQNISLVTEIRRTPLLMDGDGQPLEFYEYNMTKNGLFLSADLGERYVAYRAKSVNEAIDISKIGYYRAEDFWDRVEKGKGGYVTLNETDFYIMKSWERLVVPPYLAIEIVPHDERLAEARIHYAGYVHPGFGYDSDNNPQGTTLIFEIRPRDISIALRDDKPIAKLHYHKMYGEPEMPYNKGNNSYGNQGLKLSRCFKDFET